MSFFSALNVMRCQLISALLYAWVDSCNMKESTIATESDDVVDSRDRWIVYNHPLKPKKFWVFNIRVKKICLGKLKVHFKIWRLWKCVSQAAAMSESNEDRLIAGFLLNNFHWTTQKLNKRRVIRPQFTLEASRTLNQHWVSLLYYSSEHTLLYAGCIHA